MALSVSSSLNQKTWDATVRVTGGHPDQLWGIGAVQQAAEGEKLTVDRVLVRDAEERMVGYAQLQIRPHHGRIQAEGQQVHVNRAATVPAFMDALARYVEDRYRAGRLILSVDVPGAVHLNEALTDRGWKRLDEVEDAGIGPLRLRVPLGVSEKALSARLSETTLDRCRAGLRVSDVTVREITADSGGVRAVGLKTGQINHLLKDLGQDSLLLVAAQERPGEQPEALGYLWFVHTVGLAMLYRVGFTRKARELGIDDALLLTGAVELQKRGVQRMDGGNSQDKGVPTVVRELADRERAVLGTWRQDLAEPTGGAPASSGGTRRRRGLFARRAQDPVAALPASPEDEAAEPQRVDQVRQQVSQDLGIEMTGVTPAQREIEPEQAGAAATRGVQESAEVPSGGSAQKPQESAGAVRSRGPAAGAEAVPKPRKGPKRGSKKGAPGKSGSPSFGKRLYAEGMKAFRDAAGR